MKLNPPHIATALVLAFILSACDDADPVDSMEAYESAPFQKKRPALLTSTPQVKLVVKATELELVENNQTPIVLRRADVGVWTTLQTRLRQRREARGANLTLQVVVAPEVDQTSIQRVMSLARNAGIRGVRVGFEEPAHSAAQPATTASR